MKYSVLVGRIVSIFSVFFLNLLAARLLSQDQTGQYFLSVSWVWFSSLIIQFGSNYSLNRWLPIALEKNDKSLITTRIKLTFFTSFTYFILTAILTFILSSWLKKQLGYSYIIFLTWVALASIQMTISEIFRSFSDFKWATLIGGPLAQVLTSCIVVIFFFQKKLLNIESLVLLTVLGLGCSCVCGLLKLYPQLKKHWVPVSIDWQNDWKRHFDFFLVNILFYAFSQVDIWMVSYLSDKSAVAQYSVGQRVALLASIPASVVNLSLMPDFSRWLARGDNDKVKQALFMSSWLGGIPALILVFIIFICGNFLIQFAFGSKYASSSQIALVLALGQSFHYLVGSRGTLLLMAGKQRVVLNSVFFSICIAILLETFLFKHYGSVGIAVGSSLGLAVQTLYFIRATRRELKIYIFKKAT